MDRRQHDVGSRRRGRGHAPPPWPQAPGRDQIRQPHPRLLHVAQGRADWGVAISSVAKAYGLGFLPLTEEHYDFAYAAGSRSEALAAFLKTLSDPGTAATLRTLGFSPAAGS
ncbi:substrate-binding domain-containing protein [Hansschlegelia beijingensis]